MDRLNQNPISAALGPASASRSERDICNGAGKPVVSSDEAAFINTVTEMARSDANFVEIYMTVRGYRAEIVGKVLARMFARLFSSKEEN